MQFALRYLSVAGGLVALAVLLVIAQTDRSLERNVSSLAEARLRLVLASMGGTIQANLDFGLPLASLEQARREAEARQLLQSDPQRLVATREGQLFLNDLLQHFR